MRFLNKFIHSHPTEIRDCQPSYAIVAEATAAERSLSPKSRNDTLKNVIANLGNKGVKQPEILKLIFENLNELSYKN